LVEVSGIDGNLLFGKGYGKLRSFADNSAPEGLYQGRRVGNTCGVLKPGSTEQRGPLSPAVLSWDIARRGWMGRPRPGKWRVPWSTQERGL